MKKVRTRLALNLENIRVLLEMSLVGLYGGAGAPTIGCPGTNVCPQITYGAACPKTVAC